jgi:hypothetical protein
VKRLATIGILFALAACDRKEKPLPKSEAQALLTAYASARADEAKRREAEATTESKAAATAPEDGAPPATTEGEARPSEAPERKPPEGVSTTTVPSSRAGVPTEGPWVADEPTPIAPAGPITATAEGVVLFDKGRNVHLATLDALPRGPDPAPTPIRALPKSAGIFPLKRGPGIFRGAAYWITGNELVRRRLPLAGKAAGELEVLAKDARPGGGVATPMPIPGGQPATIPALAAYVVTTVDAEPDPEAHLLAKLWVEGHGTHLLTAEGTSTHDVRLVHLNDGVLVISMHARTAVTPVHARKVTFDDAGKPTLHEDLVVWVGGGVQPHTALTLLPGPGEGLRAFIPHEKTITDFGVAELDVGLQPSMDTATRWFLYPNGIDPAPVHAAHLCGEPVLAYAQPSTPEPDAEQELVLRSLKDPTRAQQVARANAFYGVSFAEVRGGGLLTWVADWVTWARTVRCKP